MPEQRRHVVAAIPEKRGDVLSDEFDSRGSPRSFSSPPCYAAEIAPDYFGSGGVDPEQARDVARWRKAERTRLRDERSKISPLERHAQSEVMRRHLGDFLWNRLDDNANHVFSAYWPINGEPDFRPLMRDLHDAGITVALPVVETKSAPLIFRAWTPNTEMTHGIWNIPVPVAEAPSVIPTIALAPLVGWTMEGYRLGYGGGYFDRTLAVLTPRPFVIGIGFDAAQLVTIFPQPHDISLDVIITEKGIRAEPNGHTVS